MTEVKEEKRTLKEAAKELVLSEQTASIIPFTPKDDVTVLAARLWPLFPQPEKSEFRLSQIEVYHVTEMAMAYGCNPLAINREYYAYKDKKGRIIVMPHYGKDVAWARSKEDFDDFYIEWTEEKKEASPVLDVKDVVYDCILVPKSRKQDFKDIYNNVFSVLIGEHDYDRADELATRAGSKFATVRHGRVEAQEIFYSDGNVRYGSGGKITGWIPGHDRAKIRALRNAIKSYYGIPSPEEYRKMGFDTDNPVVVEALAGMPEQIAAEPSYITARYVKLEEIASKVEQESEDMTEGEHKDRLKKNTDALRGDDAADKEDWLDEKPIDARKKIPAEKYEEALISPENEDITIGDVKSALLALGFVDHSTQLEELVTRYGTGTTFQNLTQEQKSDIVLGAEEGPDDSEPTDE